MNPLPDMEMLSRLATAAVLGALLGFERELRQKSAGLRTNMLICIGTAVFTLMSYQLAGAAGADPGRVAAQIVTGIGFLGAGAIMRTDSGVQGLTTAATVWINAAIGVAAGGGEYRLATAATVIALAVLLALDPVEGIIDRLFGKSSRPDSPTVISGGSGAESGAARPAAQDAPPRSTRR